jgi:ElaA protein
MSAPALRWHLQRLEQLPALDVYDLLALRSEVFVVEQACVFQDCDGADRASWHLLGRNPAGLLVAYLRIVDAGVKYAEPSIGRVVTSPAHRGQGYGVAVFTEGLRRAQQLWPGRVMRINAQHRLERFYQSFGFNTIGEIYIEDNIPHVEMLLAA